MVVHDRENAIAMQECGADEPECLDVSVSGQLWSHIKTCHPNISSCGLLVSQRAEGQDLRDDGFLPTFDLPPALGFTPQRTASGDLCQRERIQQSGPSGRHMKHFQTGCVLPTHTVSTTYPTTLIRQYVVKQQTRPHVAHERHKRRWQDSGPPRILCR